MFNDCLLFQDYYTKTDLNNFDKSCIEHRSEAFDVVGGRSQRTGFVEPVHG